MDQELEEQLIRSIHKSFLDFVQRAERNDNQVLINTFVDTQPLFDKISNPNNQIIFGRRGTGKTHVLKYLAEKTRDRNEVPIYIDLRSIGSNTSIYSDSSKGLAERASYLINDLLGEILSALYPVAVAVLDKVPDPNQVTLRIDDLQYAISNVKIVGTVSRESEQLEEASRDASGSLSVVADIKNVSMSASVSAESREKSSQRTAKKSSGSETLHLDFSSIQNSLSGLVEVLGVKRIWLLMDEWSEVPLDLQPYLADLVRRTILPVQRLVVKVAAIEHRSNFMVRLQDREYIGFELAADISAAVNLDDFLVFEADEAKAIQFFKNLVFRHYRSSEHADSRVTSADDLVRVAFTQQNVFSEFVKAVEGVPRDALNLAGTIAQKAYLKKITMTHVRQSARDWYQLDKAAPVRANPKLQLVLNTIIDEVIGHRKARAFLFLSNSRNQYIESLFDARILHIWKKNISSKDEPGKRFDVFKIDYGAYVDLINTANETKGLFVAEAEGITSGQATASERFVEVPRDDYRSIRRAILDPVVLEKIFAVA